MAKRQYKQVTVNASTTFMPVVAQISAVDEDSIVLVVPGWGGSRILTCPMEQIGEFRPHIKLWGKCRVEATTLVQAHEPVDFRNFQSLQSWDK